MEKEPLFGLTNLNILDNGKMVSLMVKVFTNGPMEENMKESM